jgi:hypothetical protein
MGIIRNLGEGYYGVEPSGVALRRESFHRSAEIFDRVMSIPDGYIRIEHQDSPCSSEEQGCSGAQATTSRQKK